MAETRLPERFNASDMFLLMWYKCAWCSDIGGPAMPDSTSGARPPQSPPHRGRRTPAAVQGWSRSRTAQDLGSDRNSINDEDTRYGSRRLRWSVGLVVSAGAPQVRYLPIAEHGLVGDLHTVALVGTDGTIDWYCCPRFDSPSVFAASSMPTTEACSASRLTATAGAPSSFTSPTPTSSSRAS
jgi:Trehalase-like, N-terminal